jgi:hypothetical protein
MSHDLAAVVSRLSAKPWNAAGVAPSTLDTAIGMIGPEERRALWWLAREVLRDGAIVDAGSFLGASTFCLAAGAAASPHAAERKGPIVHAFDHFKAIDAYVAETISRQVRPTAPGDSYLDLFMAQVEPHASIIRAVPGDFLQARWDEGPIDLLFVDVAKSEALNAHVVGTMFPHLVPARSVVVQQDFHHCWHPAIHVAMEFFADEFELVDELVEHQSRVWLLAREIPEEKIRRIAGRELSADERIALLDRLVEKSSARCRPMMEVTRAWQRFLDGDLDGAAADIASLRSRFDLAKVADLWARQALEVESHLGRGVTPSAERVEPSRPRAAGAVEGDHAAAAAEVRRRRRFLLGAHSAAQVEGRFPDFLVIGAQKSGTTWLHGNLLYHPEVWLPPVKEINYLNQRFAPSASGWEGTGRVRQAQEVKRYFESLPELRGVQVSRARAVELCSRLELDEDGYRSIFACADPDQVCGEVSPEYCMLPREAIRHIVAQRPAIRVILVVRDPVERAVSNMTMAFRLGYGPDPAIAVPDADLGVFTTRSNYPAMIARWRSLLPAGSLHILAYDDLRDSPGQFLREVCRILGVLPDLRLFPRRHELIGAGEPTQVHPGVLAEFEHRLAFVYEEMRELTPAIAARWQERRLTSDRLRPTPLSVGS